MTAGEVTKEEQELLKILGGFTVQTQKTIVKKKEDRPRVIVLGGPTACGKTALSLSLAKKLGGEILSADSMQVYRGMDIGTAKATVQEQQEIPHYMIDVRDVNNPLTVVDFYHTAKLHLYSILARNRVPIIVGGSGFYVHTLLYGPPKGPPPNLDLRKNLEAELDEMGANALYARLQKLDAAYAQTITCHDRQKIVRGLEIIALSGSPVSEFGDTTSNTVDYDFRCWFLYRPRQQLYQRSNERCEAMLDQGFIEEVRRLKEQGLLENRSAAQAIGYRQALEYLDSPQTVADKEIFLHKFQQATRQYIKRQFTWFAKEDLFNWLDLDCQGTEEAINIIAEDFLAR